jgi:hypothetical protein
MIKVNTSKIQSNFITSSQNKRPPPKQSITQKTKRVKEYSNPNLAKRNKSNHQSNHNHKSTPQMNKTDT